MLIVIIKGFIMFSKIFKFLSPMQWVEIILIVVIGLVVFNVGGSVIDSIQSKFGIETKSSLKQKTIEQSKMLEQIDTINKDLVKDLEILDKSIRINKDVVVEQFKAETKINSNFEKIKTKKEEHIEKIKDNFNEKPITIENTIEMEKQVSTEQITALWEMYCSGNSVDNSKQCEGINHV